MLTVPLGQGSAPFNPRSQLLPVSPSASVSVPNGTFKSGKTSRTCILSLQVSVPYRVSSKGVTKKGRKKKKAGEFIADAAADENGMFRERPSYDAYRKPHLLRVFLCLVCNFCKASKICFINNEVKFSESFSLTFQMVKS